MTGVLVEINQTVEVVAIVAIVRIVLICQFCQTCRGGGGAQCSSKHTLRREYKKAIITAKRDGWLKFTSEIKYPSDISKFIKNLNNSKNNALGLLKNSAGDYCNNPTESLNVLLSKNFPGHAALSDLEFQKKDCDGMVWKTVKNNRLDKTFTVKKVKAAFAYMGSYK